MALSALLPTQTGRDASALSSVVLWGDSDASLLMWEVSVGLSLKEDLTYL